MKGLINIGSLLSRIELNSERQSLPRPTPKPETSKVVGGPPRDPVNKQAALVIRPASSWLDQAPIGPTKFDLPVEEELARLRNVCAEFKNENAVLARQVGNLRMKLKESIQQLACACYALSQSVHEVNGLKQQLAAAEKMLRHILK